MMLKNLANKLDNKIDDLEDIIVGLARITNPNRKTISTEELEKELDVSLKSIIRSKK